MRERWRIEPGRPVQLAELDPSETGGLTREEAEEAVLGFHDQVFAFQDRLWAENRRSLFVVLQGIDASGKDGSITHVFRGVNPQATRVTAFKEPTLLELAHDFLWRVHAHVPRTGEIGIFNRSHYEDVLVVRVHKLVAESVWRARYEHINAFERLLEASGTTMVKLLLHISKDEQKSRLEARERDPRKRWKLTPSDFEEHRRFEEYQDAHAEMLQSTSTVSAPWFVVPADHKWYRNWVISSILVEVLEEMDPRYPDVPLDITRT